MKSARGIGRPVLRVFVTLFYVTLTAPLVLTIFLSFTSGEFLTFPPPGFSLRWFVNFFSSPDWIHSIQTSVLTAGVSMVISTSVGTAAAFGIVRRDFRGKQAFVLFAASPLVVPQIVIGLGLYVVALPLGLIDRWWLIALGHSVLSVPVVILVVAAALRDFDTDLEHAARSLGANSPTSLVRVTLPLVAPALVTSLAFSFIWSFDNLIIPLFLSGPEVRTLPMMMWESVRFSLDLTMLAISSLLMAFSICIVLVGTEVQRRKNRRLTADFQPPLADSAAARRREP